MQGRESEKGLPAVEYELRIGGMDARIELALTQMNAPFGRQLTIATLAQSSFLSESRFCHLFKKQLGVSPIKYLKELRMLNAEVMLRNTDERVKEIVNTLGIRNESHFLREFRAHHGIRPSQYRVLFRTERLK